MTKKDAMILADMITDPHTAPSLQIKMLSELLERGEEGNSKLNNQAEDIYSFACTRLRTIRDDSDISPATRFQAIKVLERLHR